MMINHKYYSTLEELLGNLTKKDKDYILVRHDFKKGDVVKPHYHPEANEWALFRNGKVEIILESETATVQSSGKYFVVHFPKTKFHGLKCLTDISYFVLRDKKDKTKYK